MELAIFDKYRALLGPDVINPLFELASQLKGLKIVHVNSTKEGGGVAEVLQKMVPLMEALGLDVRWEVIEGNEPFFQCTKMFHNLLQGDESRELTDFLKTSYEKTNEANAARLKGVLAEADVVFIHDPQPLPLITHFPNRKGLWVWRCHIDLSSPSVSAWDYLKNFVCQYDAAIFSLKQYAPELPCPIFIVPPSIDPFSEKNREMSSDDVHLIYQEFGISLDHPVIIQVSRFDRFKDPVGVIEAYRIVRKFYPDVQLVLAGSEATDDPDGRAVLGEVRRAAGGDPAIHILLLPASAHRQINGLQRGANIVLQKSLKEGFGLTVSEALWKSKPVIGGNVGGIRLQIIDEVTGYLVDSPKEAAMRMIELLDKPKVGVSLGLNGRKLVREKFLIIRHLHDYLSLILQCRNKDASKA